MFLVSTPAGAHGEDVVESVAFLKHVALNSRKFVTPSVFGISSARTMGAYNGFVAGAVATSSRSTKGGDLEFDASTAAGFGLGSPRKNIGFDTYLGIISVNPEGADGGFGVGEDGNMSFKAGHTFLTDSFDSISLAAGVNNLIAWGEAERINENVYGVATLGSSVMLGGSVVPFSLSLGAGAKQKQNEEFGMFAGLGANLSDLIDVSAGYNASRWVTGLTFKLYRLDNPILRRFVVQLGVDDVFDNDHNRRGVLIVAMPFSL